MITKATSLMTVLIVAMGLFAAAPADAQTSATPTWRDMPSRYVPWTNQMLRDMTQVMGQMTEQMSRTDPTLEQREQMAHRMGRMAAIMRQISRLIERPGIREKDWPKRMDEMRKQMDEMMRKTPMTPHG